MKKEFTREQFFKFKLNQIKQEEIQPNKEIKIKEEKKEKKGKNEELKYCKEVLNFLFKNNKSQFSAYKISKEIKMKKRKVYLYEILKILKNNDFVILSSKSKKNYYQMNSLRLKSENDINSLDNNINFSRKRSKIRR